MVNDYALCIIRKSLQGRGSDLTSVYLPCPPVERVVVKGPQGRIERMRYDANQPGPGCCPPPGRGWAHERADMSAVSLRCSLWEDVCYLPLVSRFQNLRDHRL